MSKESCHSCCNIAALTGYTGQEEVEPTRHLFLRLSLGLMRRNAALLMWAVSVRFVSLPKILNVPDHDFDDVVMFATAVNLKSKL